MTMSLGHTNGDFQPLLRSYTDPLARRQRYIWSLVITFWRTDPIGIASRKSRRNIKFAVIRETFRRHVFESKPVDFRYQRAGAILSRRQSFNTGRSDIYTTINSG